MNSYAKPKIDKVEIGQLYHFRQDLPPEIYNKYGSRYTGIMLCVGNINEIYSFLTIRVKCTWFYNNQKFLYSPDITFLLDECFDLLEEALPDNIHNYEL